MLNEGFTLDYLSPSLTKVARYLRLNGLLRGLVNDEFSKEVYQLINEQALQGSLKM